MSATNRVLLRPSGDGWLGLDHCELTWLGPICEVFEQVGVSRSQHRVRFRSLDERERFVEDYLALRAEEGLVPCDGPDALDALPTLYAAMADGLAKLPVPEASALRERVSRALFSELPPGATGVRWQGAHLGALTLQGPWLHQELEGVLPGLLDHPASRLLEALAVRWVEPPEEAAYAYDSSSSSSSSLMITDLTTRSLLGWLEDGALSSVRALVLEGDSVGLDLEGFERVFPQLRALGLGCGSSSADAFAAARRWEDTLCVLSLSHRFGPSGTAVATLAEQLEAGAFPRLEQLWVHALGAGDPPDPLADVLRARGIRWAPWTATTPPPGEQESEPSPTPVVAVALGTPSSAPRSVAELLSLYDEEWVERTAGRAATAADHGPEVDRRDPLELADDVRDEVELLGEQGPLDGQLGEPHIEDWWDEQEVPPTWQQTVEDLRGGWSMHTCFEETGSEDA